MKKKRYYNYDNIKRITIEHYCRICGRLYCSRQTKAFNYEPNVLKFNNFCCTNCADGIEDMNPVLMNIAKHHQNKFRRNKLANPKRKIIKNGKVYKIK